MMRYFRVSQNITAMSF